MICVHRRRNSGLQFFDKKFPGAVLSSKNLKI